MGSGAALPATTALQIGGGLYSAGQVGAQGYAQERYFNYLSNTAKTNAGLAESVATSRNKQLNTQALQEESNLAKKTNVVLGAQKAAVSMGAGTGSRTAQDLVKDTFDKSSLDEMAIRYNTAARSKGILDAGAMEAFNYNNQARGYDAAADQTARATRKSQIASILGTGTSVASNWTRYPWAGGGAGSSGGIS